MMSDKEGSLRKADKGRGEGGESQKFCRRHMYMAPYNYRIDCGTGMHISIKLVKYGKRSPHNCAALNAREDVLNM